MRARVVVAAIAALALSISAALAEEQPAPPAEEVDHLALAARMVKDGHFDRAALVLAKVDEQDDAVDKKMLHILRGLIAMNAQTYAEAAESFERAIRAGATDPAVWLSLGQARYGMKDFRGAVDALKKAGPAAAADHRAELLRSRAHWELGEPGAALDVLARAGKRFPDLIDFPRLEMHYLIELGLYRELDRRSPTFLARRDLAAGDLAALGEAMRKGGRLDEARRFVEESRLRFPDDVTLSVLLSRIYMDGGQLLTAAMILEELARLDPMYLIEAAELYRRAGRLERALFINARVADQKTKMKQRLQIHLELEQFDIISAMEARLSRLGLLEDQQIRYALAYGFFMIRDFEAAERHLRRLDDADLFARAAELRKAIASCKDAGWLCP